MPRTKRNKNRSSRSVHSLELKVGSGEMFNLGRLFCAASKGSKRTMKEIIIIMALAIAFLSVAFVLISALRGEK